MRRIFLLLCVVVAVAQASLLDTREPVTLDTAEMVRIWQTVRTGKPALQAAGGDTWQAALLAEDAELGRVLLLAWLQQLNPQAPMVQFATDYAQAVTLHLQALRGNSAACAACAGAYRAGRMGALSLPVSEQKARWFEQRAIVAGNLPQ